MGDDSLDALLKGQPRKKNRRSQVTGLKMADLLTLPSEQQSLVNWLMRHYEATASTIANHLEQDDPQVQSCLQALVERGFLKTLEKHHQTYYRVRLAPKSGRQMPKDVWKVLDEQSQQANVFISYSRRNKEFVQELHSALEATGREVWVDWENIPMAVDWWQEIQLGIELADTFVFVLSQASVASKVCGQEIEEAIKHNKRLVPVLHEDVVPDQVHPELARLNWIFLRPQDDFELGVKQLLEALDQDLDYVRLHTRLLVRALEWERSDYDSSYLLRGADLDRANHYLTQGKDQAPRPTALHHRYVLASVEVEAALRDTELERQRQVLAGQRRWLQFVTAASILSLALGLSSWALSQEAQRAQQDAKIAQQKAETSQLQSLHESSEALFLSNERFEALLTAVRAGQLFQTLTPDLQTPERKAQIMSVLQQALFWVRERNRLEGHSGTVWQVAFNPDGTLLASVGADSTARLWNLNGKELQVLNTNGFPLLDLDFAPDGQHLTAVDTDGHLYVWNSDGQPEAEWTAHTQPTRAVSFSPDGRLIASAGDDAQIKIWERQASLDQSQGGRLVRVLTGEMEGIHTLLWTQDNRIIAGDAEGSIHIWNQAGDLITTLTSHTAAITALDISSDGQSLVSVGRDRQIQLHNLTTQTTVQTIRGAHQGVIYNVRFTPDGQQFMTVGDDKLVHVWRRDGTLAETLVGHTGLVAALAIHPTRQMIATSGGDRAVRLWDLDRDNLHVLNGHQGPVNTVAISPDSQLIASGGVDGLLQLWGNQGQKLQSLEDHTNAINDLAFSRDGTQLASASTDGTARIWQQFNTPSPTVKVLAGHLGAVNGIAFHPDGQLVATAGNDQTLRLWRPDGTSVAVRQAHPTGLLSVDFSPDGQHLVSTGWDHQVRLWPIDRITTGEPMILDGHQGWVLDAQFSPNGRLVATASYDNTVKIWRVSDGQLLQTFNGHQDGVLALTFSPSGELLITASNDNTIQIWTLEGTLLTELRGHTQGVRDVAVDTPANFAVSGSTDSTVLIWERRGMDDIHALLRSSCDWLADYLNYHPKADDTVTPEIQSWCHTLTAEPPAPVEAAPIDQEEDTTPDTAPPELSP